MCGGFMEMQSRRAPRLHEEMMPHAAAAAAAEAGLISCCSPRLHQPAPAGLAIVAALEAELVLSKGATSRTKASESAPSTTSSLPIPISSSSSSSSAREEDNLPEYCNKQNHTVKNHIASGAQKSIFSTSLSPPCGPYNYIMSCSLYRELYEYDFLGACFYCKRPLAPGKDIYMYRGDRAFCSTECRYKQIVADESLPCTIQINQQCVQASSPTKQPNFTHIAILV